MHALMSDSVIHHGDMPHSAERQGYSSLNACEHIAAHILARIHYTASMNSHNPARSTPYSNSNTLHFESVIIVVIRT